MHSSHDDKLANGPSTRKSAPAALESPAPRTRSGWLDLSLTQIVAGMAAAVTAAFLGSSLGVAGTMAGAGVASVVSVVAGAVYTRSIRATRSGMRRVVGMGLAAKEQSHKPAEGPVGRPPRTGTSATRPRRSGSRSGWHVALAGAVASVIVFAGAVTVLTGVEVVSGQAVSSGTPGGLSVWGGQRPGGDAGTKVKTDQPATVPATTTTTATTSPSTATTGTSTSSPVTSEPDDGQTTTTGPTTSPTTGTTDTQAPTTGTPTATSTPATGPGTGPGPTATDTARATGSAVGAAE